MRAFYGNSEELTDAMYLDTSRDVVDFPLLLGRFWSLGKA